MLRAHLLNRPCLSLLVRPAPLAAAAVLAVNDHVLKRVAPSALTGKLSDLAGVFVLPLLLAALALALRPRARPARVVGIAAIATGALFAAAKTLPAALGWDVPWAVDPTDLVVLVVLPFAWLHALRGRAVEWIVLQPAVRLACLVLVAGATIATPAAQGVRRFPAWEVQHPSHAVGGAIVQAWVSKSGRSGFGLSIDIAAAPGSATVKVDAGATTLRLAGERIRPVEVRPARAAPGEHVRGYLAFRFDDRRAWNDGVRTAVLHLAFRVGEGRMAVPLSLVQARPHPHGRDPAEGGP